MRVLVCGSRHFNDQEYLDFVLDHYIITEIISGTARGADTMGEVYARKNNIPVLRFPALWELHGKRAGPIRNSQMLREGQPDMVVGFLYEGSRGTADMIKKAKAAQISTIVIKMPEKLTEEFYPISAVHPHPDHLNAPTAF